MRIAVLTATDSTSNAIKTVGISFELWQRVHLYSGTENKGP